MSATYFVGNVSQFVKLWTITTMNDVPKMEHYVGTAYFSLGMKNEPFLFTDKKFGLFCYYSWSQVNTQVMIHVIKTSRRNMHYITIHTFHGNWRCVYQEIGHACFVFISQRADRWLKKSFETSALHSLATESPSSKIWSFQKMFPNILEG